MSAAASPAAAAAWRAGRDAALLADVSDRLRLRVTGAARQQFLHRVTTADVNALAPDQSAPTLLVTGKGRLQDRLLLGVGETGIIVIGAPLAPAAVPGTAASSATASGTTLPDTAAALQKYIVFEKAEVKSLAESTRLLWLGGPAAGAVLAARGVEVPTSLGPPPWPFLRATLGSADVGLLPEPGPSGPAWLLLTAADKADAVRAALLETGADLGLIETDAAALEPLRVAAGVPARGSELSEDYNPLEMRLEDALSFSKGCYVGQEVIARLRTYDKVKRRLWRVELTGPANGATGLASGATIRCGSSEGIVTSIAPTPDSGAVALALLSGGDPAADAEVTVSTPAGDIPGRLLGPPPTAMDVRVAPPSAPGKRRFGS